MAKDGAVVSTSDGESGAPAPLSPQPPSARRSLAFAAVIMIGAFVMSRVSGLLRDIVVSYYFGTSPEYAAYLAANRIPDFIFQVTAGGAVASAFIPVFTEYVVGERHEAARRFISSLYTIAFAALAPLLILLALFAPSVVGVLAPEFDPELRALAANLTRVMLVAPLLFTWGCFATSILQTYQRFLLPALAPTIYNLALIGGAASSAYVFDPAERIYGLAFGAAIGSFLFLAIQVPGLWTHGVRYSPILDLADEGVRRVGLLMIPRTLGLAVAQANFLVTLYLASGIPQQYAALDYAWRLTMLPLGIFAMALASAAFPTLAEQGARRQIVEMRGTVVDMLRLILYLTIPASIGLIVLRVPIIQLLFERGDFTAESTRDTAVALQFYAASLFAQAAIEILARAFYALQDTRTPVAAAFGAMLVNAALGAALLGPLQHAGLALALSVASTAEALALLYLLRRRLGGIYANQLLGSVLRTSAAATAMGLAVFWFADDLLPSLLPALTAPVLIARVVYVGVAVAVGGAVYFGLTVALGSTEAQQVMARVRRRGKT
ncbi:MAG: murein biosynthesis integral membrane protein MurJ [Chloroflexi bacterium]|nr:murein biosynthesis integral membrane protein MurJ [Chloroflexota bacterium]